MLEAEKGKGNSERFDLGVRQSFDGKYSPELNNALLGVAPDTTRAGDLFVVFFGGRVPFILSQHEDCYSLFGECYIHGTMDGEAIDGWLEGRLREKKKTFVLV
jgi:hypothetical protein